MESHGTNQNFSVVHKISGFLLFLFLLDLVLCSSASAALDDEEESYVINPDNLSGYDLDGSEGQFITPNHSFEILGNKAERPKKQCNLFDGTWVPDSSYPLYSYQQCPYISYKAKCVANGKSPSYEKWKWKPYGCSVPRFNGSRMLEMLRGRRLMFVGDSIRQHQWESMVCLLYPFAKNSTIQMVTTTHYPLRTFRIPEYRTSIDLFWSPYLVQLKKNKRGTTVLHLDGIQKMGKVWKRAGILVFESSHWWSHTGGWDIVKSGGRRYHEMDPIVAYRKALTTWSNWVSENLNPQKNLVYFRSMSPKLDGGFECYDTKSPFQSRKSLPGETPQQIVLNQVLQQTKYPVRLLDITEMSGYRIDAHPSIFYRWRKPGDKGYFQEADCSHWCLPGVPDEWNELLYASMM